MLHTFQVTVFSAVALFVFSLCSAEGDADGKIEWFAIFPHNPLKKEYRTDGDGWIRTILRATGRSGTARVFERVCGGKTRILDIEAAILRRSAVAECTYSEEPRKHGTVTITASIPSNKAQGRVAILPPNGKEEIDSIIFEHINPICFENVLCLASGDRQHVEWAWLVFRGSGGDYAFIKIDINYADISKIQVSWGRARHDLALLEFEILSVQNSRSFEF